MLAEQISSDSIKDGNTPLIDVDESKNVVLLPSNKGEEKEVRVIAPGVE